MNKQKIALNKRQKNRIDVRIKITEPIYYYASLFS